MAESVGQHDAEDVLLRDGEFGDSKSYLERTKSTLLSYAKLSQGSDGTLTLDVRELKQLTDLDRRNRYILEPFKTVERKSIIIFKDSLDNYNLQGLLDYQREINREAFCKFGMVLGQGNCGDSRCSPTRSKGCAVGSYTVDGGHGRLGKDARISMCLNVGLVIKL